MLSKWDEEWSGVGGGEEKYTDAPGGRGGGGEGQDVLRHREKERWRSEIKVEEKGGAL